MIIPHIPAMTAAKKNTAFAETVEFCQPPNLPTYEPETNESVIFRQMAITTSNIVPIATMIFGVFMGLFQYAAEVIYLAQVVIQMSQQLHQDVRI